MLVAAVLLLVVDIVPSTSWLRILTMFIVVGFIAGAITLGARLMLARVWK